MSERKVWKRPDSVPIPTAWAVYESKKPMPNGRTPRFRIQDYSEEWKDDVLYNMTNYFYRDEPLSKAIRAIEDPVAVEELKEFINDYLNRKMVLIAVVDNYDELGDKTLPRLAGCNITGIVFHDENLEKSKSEKLQKILDLLEEFKKKIDCFKHYNVTECMYALGLSVHPSFRGHGLAVEILKARFPLCKAAGIKVTVTAFTARTAQKAAEKAGFKTLAEIIYKEYKDKNGQIVFNMDEPKSVKLMGIVVP